MNHEGHDEIEDHEEFLITQSSCSSIVFVAFVARTEI